MKARGIALREWHASAMSPTRSVHALIRLRGDKREDLRLFHPMREAMPPRHLLEQGTPQSWRLQEDVKTY
jgi:hypothetical protein